MMQPQHKRHARRVGPLAIASLLLGLTACGGGSNEQDTGKDPTVGQTVPGKVTLTGVVSKGRMAGAQVTAHPVKNGVVDASTVLATGLTDTDGRFDLPAFVPTAGSPVVVLVKITDKTVHVDELSQKPLPLPSTFTMRSAVVPAAVADDKTVTLPVNITPFSEMVVRAAESAPARLDKASVAQGKSAVTQMLGFDPIATDVSGVRASNTVAVNAQGLMLAAVAQLATGPDSEALGCKKSTAGEAIACTVDKLAQAAKLDTVKLVVDKVDVGAGLSRAIDAVSGNETVVPKDVDLGTTVGDVTGRLACEPGSATRPCEVPKVDEQTTGVAAAKAMFTALRTALNGWFSRGGLAGAGQLNQDATAFEAALTRARFPLDQISQDLAVMQLGIQLYEDYMSGRTTDPSKGTWKGRAPGHQKYTWANGDVQKYSGTWEENAIGCTLFQADKKTPATEPSNVAEIGCRSSFRMEIERIAPTSTAAGLWRVTDWRHGFTPMPGAAGASGERVFTYTSSASKRVRAIACTGSTDPRAMSCGTLVEDTALRVDLQLDADGKRRGFGGSIAVSPQDSRTLTLKVSGQLPGLIDGGTAEVVNDHQDIALTTQDDGSATSVMALAGKVQTFEKIDLTTASSTLELTPGSQVTFIASNEDGSRPAEGATVAFRRVAASRIGLIWRAHHQDLAFIGNKQGIQPQQFAGGAYRGRHGKVFLLDQHAHPGLVTNLVERRGYPAACGIAQGVHAWHGVQQRCDQPLQRRRIRHDGRIETQVLALRHHRHAVIADGAGDDQNVAGAQAWLADGSLQRLFQRHFGDLISRHRLAQRVVLNLHNPLLPPATPLNRPAFWLVLLITPVGWFWQLAAFILFRLFDIVWALTKGGPGTSTVTVPWSIPVGTARLRLPRSRRTETYPQESSMIGTVAALLVVLIIVWAGLGGLRRVLKLDPAAVFRG